MARVTLPVVLPSVVDELEVFNLPNPASGKRQFYGQDKSSKRLYELIQVDNGTPRSWLFEKRVQSAPIDPLFLMLPVLMRAVPADEQFTTADNIFHDPENPAVTRLEHVPQLDAMLSLVCDAKGDDDFRVYRINDAKLLQWLIAKLDTMADGIAANEITPSGVASASFKAISTPSNVTARQRYSYAAGMLGEYVSKDLLVRLQQELGLEVSSRAKRTPTAASGDGGKYAGLAPLEDYSKVEAKKAKKVAVATAPKGCVGIMAAFAKAASKKPPAKKTSTTKKSK